MKKLVALLNDIQKVVPVAVCYTYASYKLFSVRKELNKQAKKKYPMNWLKIKQTTSARNAFFCDNYIEFLNEAAYELNAREDELVNEVIQTMQTIRKNHAQESNGLVH